MELRDYQTESIAAIHEQWRTAQSTLAVLSTGLGKSVIGAAVAADRLNLGRVMWLCHRSELVYQAFDHLQRACQVKPAIEMAESWSQEVGMFADQSPVVISTVQTQISGTKERRYSRFDPSQFSTLIVDESQHSVSPSHRLVIDHYRKNPKLRVLGLTATPDRFDEEALGQIFETVAVDYSLLDGINNGWLVPVEQRLVFIEDLDFSGVRTQHGDFCEADLQKLMEREKNLHGIADATIQQAGERLGLIFAASVAQAEKLCEILNRHKTDCASAVFGHTAKEYRKDLVGAFKAGRFQFMVNVGVFTEGTDLPDTSLVVMGRPTQSRSLFAQMIGRGLRPPALAIAGITDPDERRTAIAASDKANLLVLDFIGNSGKHKLIHATDALGGNCSDEVIALAERLTLESNEGKDVQTAISEAEHKIAEQQRIAREKEAAEAARRKHIIGKATYRTRTIDPFDVLGIMPPREFGGIKSAMATDPQAKLLERFGVQNAIDLTKRQAGVLIGELIGNRKKGLPTFKQIKVLRGCNWYEDGVTYEEAHRRIGILVANKWQRPAGAV